MMGGRCMRRSGKGPLKILTIPYLSQILKNSVLFYTENTTDKQRRKVTYYNYAYPVIFDNNGGCFKTSVLKQQPLKNARFARL
jgi:hypothetical protein